MTNLSIISQDEVSENQVIRSRVAKTQQPDAERLINNFSMRFLSRKIKRRYDQRIGRFFVSTLKITKWYQIRS